MLKKIFFSFLFLFFLSGCGVNTTPLVFEKKVANPPPPEEILQYAAPWNLELYENHYADISDLDLSKIKGGIVPHHLVAGNLIANWFGNIAKQKPDNIVILSPDHFGRGKTKVSTSLLNWNSVYGKVEINKNVINQLLDNDLVNIDEEAISEEHGLYSLVNYLVKSSPNTKLIPLILRNDLTNEEMDSLVSDLMIILPKDTVILSSIDFSHYQTYPVAEYHDEYSLNVIKNFSFDQLKNLEIDSIPSLYTLLKLMENYNTQKLVHFEHSNTATISGLLRQKETTSHYSMYFSEGEKGENNVVSMLFFGDMMLDRNVKDKIDKYGADYIFEKLAGEENRFFGSADIIHANLEGPFANYRRETTKEIAFRFDPVLIPTLVKYNFNLFTIANNHSYDMSSTGLQESRENLDKYGIGYYGEQFGINDNTVLLKDINGYKFAFVGLNDTNQLVDFNQSEELIRNLKEKNDFVIINIHWGNEYSVLESNTRQQSLGHHLVDAGGDLIIGHHPHVIQEMEVYNNVPIFYSLGNFVFDQYFSEPTQKSLAVGAVFYQDKLSLHVFPLQGISSQASLIAYEQAKTILRGFIDKSRLNTYTFDKFNLLINR